ncbi:hypothetical protein BH24ACT5_BH24ACT5_03300 [soil metagenome]
MTAPTITPSDRVAPGSIRQLAHIEAARSLRRISIWAGAALTVVILAGETTADWSGGSYIEKLPQSFMPIILGAFIAALRTGWRDRRHDVSESAPLDPNDRAAARLAGMALPVLLTVVIVIGFAVTSRIEGGFWIGDSPRRTDTALHSIAELLQPPLVVAFAVALGVAIGRARARLSITLAIIAGMALFTMFPGYWLWNIPPVHAFTPVQTQPLVIDLDAATSIDQIPADWFVEFDGNQPTTRQLVHQPTILGHTLYLVGLTALAAGLALRASRGRRLAALGGAVAVVGIVAQLVVSPL